MFPATKQVSGITSIPTQRVNHWDVIGHVLWQQISATWWSQCSITYWRKNCWWNWEICIAHDKRCDIYMKYEPIPASSFNANDYCSTFFQWIWVNFMGSLLIEMIKFWNWSGRWETVMYYDTSEIIIHIRV